MRIGAMLDDSRPIDDVVGEVRGFAEAGLSAAWCAQIFGYDALTLLTVVGREVPGIELGTGVVPVYPRHPQMLAQQAATANEAVGGRLVLGVGLSHPVVVEGIWGMSYEKPVRYMREYLSILVPLLQGETVTVEGEVLTAKTFSPLPGGDHLPVPVVVAALGPAMLGLAGRVAAGTVTFMTGTRTVAEHITPTITAAAREAGRPAPRVVVALPVAVTDDVDAARAHIDQAYGGYPSLPSYHAMLEREGAALPSDISLVGAEGEVTEGLERVRAAGATDFVAVLPDDDAVRRRTLALLGALSA
jgi:F420-dependent oxidoreductase-like protein